MFFKNKDSTPQDRDEGKAIRCVIQVKHSQTLCLFEIFIAVILDYFVINFDFLKIGPENIIHLDHWDFDAPKVCNQGEGLPRLPQPWPYGTRRSD